MRTGLILIVLLVAGCSLVWGQSLDDVKKLFLWPEAVPAAAGTSQKDIPFLIPYLPEPEKATGIAVVVCPGGGYGHLAMDHEGKQVGRWFQDIGIAAFILKYRLPSDGYRNPIPLLDAQRAVRLVRSKADEFKINPDSVGIMGFSAGGHLASTVGTHFTEPAAVPGYTPDAVDTLSPRPDFMILAYPVISMQKEITHQGSRNNLLGPEPKPELVQRLSNELQVTPQTPPTFLVLADDDKAVVPENSIRFYEALQKAHVSAEMHIFPKGGHGFGMRAKSGPLALWPKLCENWIEQLQLPAQNKSEK